MASAPAQNGIVPLPRAIDHYFELSLYLLVLTGFGTLSATGGLDLPSMILVAAAPGVRALAPVRVPWRPVVRICV